MFRFKKKQTFLKKLTKKYSRLALFSFSLNIVFLVAIIASSVYYLGGYLDYAISNQGISIMCSDHFRERHVNLKKDEKLSDERIKSQIAHLDYICATYNPRSDHGNAKKYYLDGYNNYRKSLGLPTE